AEQDPKQRSLAGAVRTDEADAVAAHDAAAEVPDDRTRRIPEALRNILRLENHPSGGLGLFDAEPDRTHLLASGGALCAHGHQSAHAAFVSRPPGLDALAQPGFFFSQFLVEALAGRGFRGERLLFPPQICLIVAGPRRQRPSIDLDDARGEAFE